MIMSDKPLTRDEVVHIIGEPALQRVMEAIAALPPEQQKELQFVREPERVMEAIAALPPEQQKELQFVIREPEPDPVIDLPKMAPPQMEETRPRPGDVGAQYGWKFARRRK